MWTRVFLICLFVFLYAGCLDTEEGTPHDQADIDRGPLENASETIIQAVATTNPPATPPPESIAAASPHGKPGDRTARMSCRGECHPDYPWPRLLDIPFYEQETNESCGQAVLQMTLAYYGINKTQKQISKEMKFGKTYPSELALYLEKQGFNASMLELGDDMWEFDPYAGKYPVLVLNHGEVVDIPLHWVLLKGRGELGYTIIDPANGERNWIPGENYTVIVVEGF